MSPDTPAAKPAPPLGAAQGAFAAALVGLGAYGFVRHGFTPIWAPVAKSVPARGALVYVCASVSLVSGLGLLSRAYAAAASRLLLALLLAWWVWLRLPLVAAAPANQEPWSGCAETTVFVAAAWVLYALLATGWERRYLPFATGRTGIRVAQVLYGCALIPFGTAHFVYLRETAALVPPWLPLPTYWAYFTGFAFIAAGIALITTLCRGPAAILSACQLGLFTLLVWLPILARGNADPYMWSEGILSAALTVAAWVVAQSCRDKSAGPGA